MQKILTIGTIVLGCCLAGVAQAGSSSNENQGATQPNYSQGEAGQTQQANPGQTEQAVPGNSEAQSNSAQQSANQKATVQGCLSQSPEGNFMLADAAGNQFQLKGSSDLNQFVGQEIRVDGTESAIGSSSPGAMSEAPAGSSELKGSVQQITVNKITKVADTCQTSSGSKY
jgi:hypothetical protein